MRRRIAPLFAILLSLSGAPAVARAADPAPAPASADPGEQRARALFLEGSQLYDQADFDGAIARFEEAYRLSSLPALLFNIAQAHRAKGPGHCSTALHYYERYLHDEPTASNRQEIEELIQELQLCAAAERAPVISPAVVAPAPPPISPPAPRWPRRMAVAGAGALGLGVGGYLAALAKYQSVKDGGPYPTGRFRTWELVTDASYGLMALGGSAVLFSAAWTLGHRGTDADPPLRVSLGAGPLVRLDGRF